jgi:DNA-binding NarL/FixJ family response regulator
MANGLDVVVVDDDPITCQMVSKTIQSFYAWGDVHAFTAADEAREFCLARDAGIGIFVVDVYLDRQSGFFFLDALEDKYPALYQDTIIITGSASDEVVDMCVASEVNHLLEKPVKPYALQLAVRSIVAKYIKFSQRLLQDPAFAEAVNQLEQAR